MQVMIIDDECIVLESCKRILASEGFETLQARTADEAIFHIEKNPPALLLLDLKMPMHDGVYLMKTLRERGIELPVIIMSGYSTEETINESKEMGARLFLSKPFTPDELLEAVRQVLERR